MFKTIFSVNHFNIIKPLKFFKLHVNLHWAVKWQDLDFLLNIFSKALCATLSSLLMHFKPFFSVHYKTIPTNIFFADFLVNFKTNINKSYLESHPKTLTDQTLTDQNLPLNQCKPTEWQEQKYILGLGDTSGNNLIFVSDLFFVHFQMITMKNFADLWFFWRNKSKFVGSNK